jgi:hypothetical protein
MRQSIGFTRNPRLQSVQPTTKAQHRSRRLTGRLPARNGGLARRSWRVESGRGLYGGAAGARGGSRENVASVAQSGGARADDGPTGPRWPCGLAQHVLRVRWPTSCPWVRLHPSSTHPAQRVMRSREHKRAVSEAQGGRGARPEVRTKAREAIGAGCARPTRLRAPLSLRARGLRRPDDAREHPRARSRRSSAAASRRPTEALAEHWTSRPSPSAPAWLACPVRLWFSRKVCSSSEASLLTNCCARGCAIGATR